MLTITLRMSVKFVKTSYVNYNTKDECKVCQNVIEMNGQ